MEANEEEWENPQIMHATEQITSDVVPTDARQQAVQLAAACGLQLIETNCAALQAESVEDTPVATLRRSDIPVVATPTMPVEMVQIETIK